MNEYEEFLDQNRIDLETEVGYGKYAAIIAGNGKLKYALIFTRDKIVHPLTRDEYETVIRAAQLDTLKQTGAAQLDTLKQTEHYMRLLATTMMERP
jgi:hypothetical protein